MEMERSVRRAQRRQGQRSNDDDGPNDDDHPTISTVRVTPELDTWVEPTQQLPGSFTAGQHELPLAREGLDALITSKNARQKFAQNWFVAAL
jgi:hypothetical protein